MKRLAFGAVFSACLLASNLVPAQAPDWKAQLIDKPLYLRGFWIADELHFAADGSLLSRSGIGPVTLSGVDVTDVQLQGKRLKISGIRVALVARKDSPGLVRRRTGSTTELAYSLRRGDKRRFYAPESITLVIDADSSGSFSLALSRVFANGLRDLANSVPLYWRCYAASYFQPQISPDADEEVNHCVVSPADGSAGPGYAPDVTPPELLSRVPAQFPARAAELDISGTSVIHLRVREDGTPIGLQIVQAIGAGVDEALLQAISQERFRPATRDGTPVAFNLNQSSRLDPAP